ncbi:putative phage abortive infection protein [Enterobacter hormaechei]|uniref:putative phage abortive infection protein n=1 Tax=Enterobacter hormaechei TaxID=158836 RepID=UPI001BCFD2E0|nr:putative phage abortive infection protein [Enterobacter hormaechei]
MVKIINYLKRLSFILIFVLITCSFIVFALYKYWTIFGALPASQSVEKWGQFGDYIGGVLNPGLSFLSIILVCFTLYTTSKQSITQSFESVLFELLRYHKEHLSNIKVVYDKESFKGVDALDWYITEVKFNFLNLSNDDMLIQERVKFSIDLVYEEDNFFSNTGHYFRNLYHIFKHIDEASFLRKKERFKYAKLVRAQLSSIESGALMLNGLSSKGVKSKVYIEKYSLLQGFTLSKSFKNELKSAGAMRLYNPVAYGDK